MKFIIEHRCRQSLRLSSEISSVQTPWASHPVKSPRLPIGWKLPVKGGGSCGNQSGRLIVEGCSGEVVTGSPHIAEELHANSIRRDQKHVEICVIRVRDVELDVDVENPD